MDIVSKFLPFVNDQAEFHEKMAERFATDPKRADRHTATGRMFRELAAELSTVSERLTQPVVSDATKKPIQNLYLSLEEVEGLPEELMKELSISEGDRTDYAILRIVDECGGVASIDRILLSLYQKTKEVVKRQSLTSRLYRMAQKGLLFPVPERKGVYSTRDLTMTEAEALLG